MRRSRLKILPARGLTYVGFILVMLVCPSIAEVAVGIEDVNDSGHSDSHLHHPATHTLRDGFEFCHMGYRQQHEALPTEHISDGHIVSIKKMVRLTRSVPKPFCSSNSNRDEQYRNCYDLTRNKDNEGQRNTMINNNESKLRKREIKITRDRISEITASQTRNRLISERRNSLLKKNIMRRISEKKVPLNYEKSGKIGDDERALNRIRHMDNREQPKEPERRLLANLAKRMVRSTDRSLVRIEERQGERDTSSGIRQVHNRRQPKEPERRNLTSKKIRSAERMLTERRSMVDVETQLTTRDTILNRNRYMDNQKQQKEPERKNIANRATKMVRSAETMPPERKSMVDMETHQNEREKTLNGIRHIQNRRQPKEQENRNLDIRATRLVSSIERMPAERSSIVDMETQRIKRDKSSIGIRLMENRRQPNESERRNLHNRATRMVRSAARMPTERRSIIDMETQRTTRDKTLNRVSHMENRRQPNDLERRNLDNRDTRMVRSAERMPAERRSIVDMETQRTRRDKFLNEIRHIENQRQPNESGSRILANVATSKIRSGEIMPAERRSMIDKEDQQPALERKLNGFQRMDKRRQPKEPERRNLSNRAPRMVRSTEIMPAERSSMVDMETHQNERDKTLNGIRHTENRNEPKGPEKRNLDNRATRMVRSAERLPAERRSIIDMETQRTTSDESLNGIRQMKNRRQPNESERSLDNRATRMVRSAETMPQERRSIIDMETQRTARDEPLNGIRHMENRRQPNESERRNLDNRATRMVRSAERMPEVRRSMVDMDTQRTRRDKSLNGIRHMENRRQPIESERRNLDNRATRMSRSAERMPAERKSTVGIESQKTTRDTFVNGIRLMENRRQPNEPELRNLEKRATRMVRSVEGMPAERRSMVNMETKRTTHDKSMNGIRLIENQRQPNEQERTNIANSNTRLVRIAETMSVERRSVIDIETQHTARETALNGIRHLDNRRRTKELERRNLVNRSTRILSSTERMPAERRSILDMETQRTTRDKSLNGIRHMENRRQPNESERRNLDNRATRMVRSAERMPAERRSKIDMETQRTTRDESLNGVRHMENRRQPIESERRNLDNRDTRMVRSAERMPAERRSKIDMETQRTTRDESWNGIRHMENRRQPIESERRNLDNRDTRMIRSAERMPAERRSKIDMETQRTTRDESCNGIRHMENRRQPIESERRNLDNRATRMVRSAERTPAERRSIVDKETQRTRRDKSLNGIRHMENRRQPNESERRNLDNRATGMVRSAERMPAERRSKIDMETQRTTRDESWNGIRHMENRRQPIESERRNLDNRATRMVRSAERTPAERRSIVDKETQRTRRDKSLNGIRHMENRRQPNESERRNLDNRATGMVRSAERMPAERRSKIDMETQRTTRDESWNGIRHMENRRQPIESERRNLDNRATRMMRSAERTPAERRSIVDKETQRTRRDKSLNGIRHMENRRQPNESERRNLDNRATGMVRSAERMPAERRSKIDMETQRTTRDESWNGIRHMENRRQPIESERRNLDNRATRMERSAERTPAERRSIVDKETQRTRRDKSLNGIRHMENRRQPSESERRNLDNRATGMVRSAERMPAVRRSMVDMESQRTTRDNVLNGIRYMENRRQPNEQERRNIAYRAKGVVKSAELISAQRRLLVEKETHQNARNRTLNGIRQMDNRILAKEPERRNLVDRATRVVRSAETLHTERRSIVEMERQRTKRDTFLNGIRHMDNRRQPTEPERRYHANRATRMVIAAETIHADRKLMVEMERHHFARDTTFNGLRHVHDLREPKVSNGRNLARRSIMMVRSTGGKFVIEMEWQRSTRDKTINGIIHLDDRRQSKESEIRNIAHLDNRMVYSAESTPADRRSILEVENQQFRRPELGANLLVAGFGDVCNNDTCAMKDRSMQKSGVLIFNSVGSIYTLTSVLPLKEAWTTCSKINCRYRSSQNFQARFKICNGPLYSRNMRKFCDNFASVNVASESRMIYQNHPPRRVNIRVFPIFATTRSLIHLERSKPLIKYNIGSSKREFGTRLAETRWSNKGVTYEIRSDMPNIARKAIIMSNDTLLSSERRASVTQYHEVRETKREPVDIRKISYNERKWDFTDRTSRYVIRNSVTKSLKYRNNLRAENMKSVAESNSLSYRLTQRITTASNKMSTIQNTDRLSQGIRRKIGMEGAMISVSENNGLDYMSTSVQRINNKNRNVIKAIKQLLQPNSIGQGLDGVDEIPNTEYYDAAETHNIILDVDKDKERVLEPTLNGSSTIMPSNLLSTNFFSAQLKDHEVYHQGKLILNPILGEDEGFENTKRFSKDKLFSITIGGSVAALLISTSLK